MTRVLAGHCLCGAVTLRARTAARVAHECHCTQCRKQSGHVWSYVTVPRARVEWRGEIAVYAHSDRATRGFCPVCGSFLYWSRNGSDKIDISAALFDPPTGLRLGAPSFPESKGDYYDMADHREHPG